MEKDDSPQLLTPESAKTIISRIQTAQLTRTRENISSELSNILDNVNSVISRFQKELGYDLREKSESHHMVEKGKNRFILLEKITSLSTDAQTKEKHLYEILHWLGDWGDSLTYEIRNRKNEKDEESQDEWIEVIEKMLPLSLIATKGGIESLISLCSTLIEGERRRAQMPKYTFWQGWQEKDQQTSPSPSRPLSPQQMFQDKHTICTRASEVKSMLQELLDSARFSTGEARAIRYISSVVENLSKALILQQEENKILETKYRCLKTEMVQEVSSQRLKFQKSLQTLEIKRDALLKQVEILRKKCHELCLIKQTLEYKLKEAEVAVSQAEDSAMISDDSPDSPQEKTLPEEKSVMTETEQEQEEEEQLFLSLAQIDMDWDSQPSSYQSLPTMTTNPGIVDVISSKDTKVLGPKLLSSGKSPDHRDTNQKDFLQEASLEKEDMQDQLHFSKQQAPESFEKEVDQSTWMEHWGEKLSWQKQKQKQKQQWLQQEMWQQWHRTWPLLEQEHMERLRQWKQKVPKKNVVQGLKEQKSPRKEPKEDVKRKLTVIPSQGKPSKGEAPLTALLSQTQSVPQCRRPHVPRPPCAQPVTPRNQRTVSSAEFNQKPGAHRVLAKPRKAATSPALGLFLCKRSQSPLHISPVPLKAKVYHMAAKALRKNLWLLLGSGHSGMPAALHSKALELTTTTMELSLLRLQCLCLKYIHYRGIQSLRQETINHIQDMQNTRAPYQAHNLSIFLENINSLQNLKMQTWTDRQKAVEEKYQECLSNMMTLFPKLRLERNIPLQLPRITSPKLRKNKSFPSLLQRTQSSNASLKPPFTSNSPDSESLRKVREQGDHMKTVWKTDVASSSYLIEEKIPARLHWEQLGGHPDIPRLLTLDIHSCYHKSLMQLKAW
ncbi:protein FAM186B [Sorex araneus]|uniref:protein FAM186B n=1 Tax=Sorex araneus TaxID=42254 RepID=UPI0024336233|nr:protein FAM186B [Sorex araneus]